VITKKFGFDSVLSLIIPEIRALGDIEVIQLILLVEILRYKEISLLLNSRNNSGQLGVLGVFIPVRENCI
jgi:hypothetical protein